MSQLPLNVNLRGVGGVAAKFSCTCPLLSQIVDLPLTPYLHMLLLKLSSPSTYMYLETSVTLLHLSHEIGIYRYLAKLTSFCVCTCSLLQ